MKNNVFNLENSFHTHTDVCMIADDTLVCRVGVR